MVSFAEYLTQESVEVRESIFETPFFKAISNNTLPVNILEHYLRQEYHILMEYIRVLSVLCAKTSSHNITLPTSIIIDSFIEMLKAININDQPLSTGSKFSKLEPSPTTFAFGNYMKKIAFDGTHLELYSVILSFYYDRYSQSQRMLSIENGLREYLPLSKIFKFYTSTETYMLYNQLTSTLPAMDNVDEKVLLLAKQRYLETARYNYLYYVNVWHCECWTL